MLNSCQAEGARLWSVPSLHAQREGPKARRTGGTHLLCGDADLVRLLFSLLLDELHHLWKRRAGRQREGRGSAHSPSDPPGRDTSGPYWTPASVFIFTVVATRELRSVKCVRPSYLVDLAVDLRLVHLARVLLTIQALRRVLSCPARRARGEKCRAADG